MHDKIVYSNQMVMSAAQLSLRRICPSESVGLGIHMQVQEGGKEGGKKEGRRGKRRREEGVACNNTMNTFTAIWNVHFCNPCGNRLVESMKKNYGKRARTFQMCYSSLSKKS